MGSVVGSTGGRVGRDVGKIGGSDVGRTGVREVGWIGGRVDRDIVGRVTVGRDRVGKSTTEVGSIGDKVGRVRVGRDMTGGGMTVVGSAGGCVLVVGSVVWPPFPSCEGGGFVVSGSESGTLDVVPPTGGGWFVGFVSPGDEGGVVVVPGAGSGDLDVVVPGAGGGVDVDEGCCCVGVTTLVIVTAHDPVFGTNLLPRNDVTVVVQSAGLGSPFEVVGATGVVDVVGVGGGSWCIGVTTLVMVTEHVPLPVTNFSPTVEMTVVVHGGGGGEGGGAWLELLVDEIVGELLVVEVLEVGVSEVVNLSDDWAVVGGSMGEILDVDVEVV